MEPIQSNKIYPIGIQNFEKMRKGGYFYVDKTALVYRLVKTGSYYFLSRPRRFGKSLLISTLEAYFQGKKELFEGLAMEKLEKDWIKRPVLHIDLNIGKYDTPDSLDKQLEKAVTEWRKARLPFASPEWSGVPASRRGNVWPSSSTNTTSPCCKPSATKRCRTSSATP